jgi:hypothetical protein
MDLGEIGWGGMNWRVLVQYMNTIIYKMENS